MNRFLIVIAALCCTTSALAADWNDLTSRDNAPRAMLYFNVPLGATPGRDAQLRYGLRLEQQVGALGANLGPRRSSIAAGLAAGLCLAEELICEEDSSSPTITDGPITTPGG